MQHDEMIWQIVNKQFCSFQTTLRSAQSDNRQFCKHQYSVTGLCNRASCPLANSKYAVVKENEGQVSLFIKTAERAHSPKNLWEKIVLSRNYAKALAQLEEHLAFFPKNLIHRNKQRLTKIHQYLIRMRKIQLKERAGRKVKLVPRSKKVDVREDRREKKALVAAKIEEKIEKELVERLAKGTYGDIYNFPEVEFSKAMEKVEDEEEEEESEEEEEEEEAIIEYVEDLEEEEEDEQDVEDFQYLGDGKWAPEMESSSGDDDDSSDDDEDEQKSPPGQDTDKGKPASDGRTPKAKRKPRERIEIEYEEEPDDMQLQEENIAGMAW